MKWKKIWCYKHKGVNRCNEIIIFFSFPWTWPNHEFFFPQENTISKNSFSLFEDKEVPHTSNSSMESWYLEPFLLSLRLLHCKMHNLCDIYGRHGGTYWLLPWAGSCNSFTRNSTKERAMLSWYSSWPKVAETPPIDLLVCFMDKWINNYFVYTVKKKQNFPPMTNWFYVTCIFVPHLV